MKHVIKKTIGAAVLAGGLLLNSGVGYAMYQAGDVSVAPTLSYAAIGSKFSVQNRWVPGLSLIHI